MEELVDMRSWLERKWCEYYSGMESITEIEKAERKGRSVNRLLTVVDDSADLIIRRFRHFYLLIKDSSKLAEVLADFFGVLAHNNKRADTAYGIINADIFANFAGELSSKPHIPAIAKFYNGELEQLIMEYEIQKTLINTVQRVCGGNDGDCRSARINSSNDDSLKRFIEECIVVNPQAWISKEELYNAYRNYCRRFRLPILDKKAFGRRLQRFVRVQVYRPRFGRIRVWAWQGIQLKDFVVSSNIKLKSGYVKQNNRWDYGQKNL